MVRTVSSNVSVSLFCKVIDWIEFIMAPIHTIAQAGFGSGTNLLYDRSV